MAVDRGTWGRKWLYDIWMGPHPAIQAELKDRRKMSDLVELTAEHKTKIRLALFDMPRELRERYWKETNYGKHPNRITAHLLNAILER